MLTILKQFPVLEEGVELGHLLGGECLHQTPEQLLPLNFSYINLLVLPVCLMFGEGGRKTFNLSLLHILVTLNKLRLQYFLVVFVLACVCAEESFLSLSLPVSLCELC